MSEELLYLPTERQFAEVEGVTYLARPVRAYPPWYDYQLLTKEDGSPQEQPPLVTVQSGALVGRRQFRSLPSPHFFVFETEISATNYARRGHSLATTSRTALGSGIMGLYRNAGAAGRFRIDCPKSYFLQDKEHGDSVILASLHTNRLIDRFLERLVPPTAKEVGAVVTLWNLALSRTGDQLTLTQFQEIVTQYLDDWKKQPTIFDSRTGEGLQELPINRVLRSLGYDGVVSVDEANNGWGKGCVAFTVPEGTPCYGGRQWY
jgi:hypothetical protein